MKSKFLSFIAISIVLVQLLGCKSTQKTEGTQLSSSKSGSDMVEIIHLADKFKASLNEEQLAQLQLPYSKTNATKWSNFPASFRNAKRVGLNFGAMTDVQLQHTKALLQQIAGSGNNEGWDELQQLLNADDYLGANGGGREYGAANYYIAFLGTPATTGTFEIQFGGHHLAFANTYKDGVLIGATPSFRGVEPSGTFSWNGKNNQPLNQEQEALSALLQSFSKAELDLGRLSNTYGDLLLGPGKDGAFPTTPSGIKCSNLSSLQKKLVADVIKTYTSDIDEKNASAILKKYMDELSNTYIAFSGTTGMKTRNDYVRLDGPSLWIEYSAQGGIIIRGITHPHSVWRDKLNDYGGN